MLSLGHGTHSSKHQTLPYTWAGFFLSDKAQQWFGSLRVVDITLIHSAQCFAVVLLWTISLIIASPRMRSVLRSWKCFSMNLSVYSIVPLNIIMFWWMTFKIKYGPKFVVLSILIFIYTYDYICILYTNRSNVFLTFSTQIPSGSVACDFRYLDEDKPTIPSCWLLNIRTSQ